MRSRFLVAGLMLLLALAGLAGCAGGVAAPLTQDALKGAEFRSEMAAQGTVRLVDGQYEE
ncbi:MAG: hypothetical protein GX605_00025, partial [Chloroflexi bacterium]|nr:hypothetical protein [Chloroflexota bacterium]